MRTVWDKTTTRRPSRNAEIIYELVTANARDLAALRTHGCPVGEPQADTSRTQQLAAFDRHVSAQLTIPPRPWRDYLEHMVVQPRLAPAVTSSLWAAKASRTSAFSRFGILK